MVVGGRKYDPVTSASLATDGEAYSLQDKLLLTYKARNGLAPLYKFMCDTLELFIATRRLRSSDNYVLNVPRYNLKSYGGRAFSVAAPKLWNKFCH